MDIGQDNGHEIFITRVYMYDNNREVKHYGSIPTRITDNFFKLLYVLLVLFCKLGNPKEKNSKYNSISLDTYYL